MNGALLCSIGCCLFAATLATAEETARDFLADATPPPAWAPGEITAGTVRVEILEHRGGPERPRLESRGGNDSAPSKEEAGREAAWSDLPEHKSDEFVEEAFAFGAIPAKYSKRGVRVDRSRPFLVRATAAIVFPPGRHQLLLRSLGSARLSIDGCPLAVTEHVKGRGRDDEPVPDPAARQLFKEMPLLPPGESEVVVTFAGDGQPHLVTVEAFVGGKSIRPELGELFLAIRRENEAFELLSPQGSRSSPLDNHAWRRFVAEQRSRVARLDADRRRNRDEERYWARRHEMVRRHLGTPPPVPEADATGAIDRFIEARLKERGLAPPPLLDDTAFLRRVTLDTIGLLPTPDEVRTFVADLAADKRDRAIERLVGDPRWADHWTSYWQDVLAENPNMLKGTLNNTGPFRWWIYEALLDNKPLDRFATELISMEGSAQYGGPAGFALATQNDLPLAAKAQIVSSAFLAREMKCARCHDAPFHSVDQADLFQIAAMLQRGAIKVPKSSLTQGLPEESHVTVSLKAGQSISPHWPFGAISPLPGIIRREGDTRELLAALVTDPRDGRFAEVLANRVWKQLIGVGIVEPVDDWENAAPSHPDLLRWLGWELSASGYDFKHLARLILRSQLYQRVATAEGSRIGKSAERFFTSPARRRMTAEQLVDSLFRCAGKDFDSELLSMDPEGRQVANDLGNLGRPERAWQFAPLSNERDRPALAKPRAQVIADVLATFGWRESRAEPRSSRDHEANVLQPALLANGALGRRMFTLSDESAFTALALESRSVPELTEALFIRILSRSPARGELQAFAAHLEDGFAMRATGRQPAAPRRRNTKAVSWANHLNPDATNVVLAIEKEVRAGEPPTPQLENEWRERMEDAIWALIVSPEFIHLP